MRLRLDTVTGHEVISSIGNGRISRMALATISPAELPSLTPSPSQLVLALSALGLPQKGDTFPFFGYDKYILKTHIARSFDALNYGIEMIYEYKGLLTVQDTSTLSSVPTQLHPKDFKPLYVKYTPPGPNGQQIKKLLTLNTMVPMRHVIVSAQVDYQAGGGVLEAFPSVNQIDWMGLPAGYWLYSGIDAYTDDNGLTRTYTATFSTKMTQDWSQLGFIEDDSGQAIAVPEADVAALRAKPYAYGQDDSVNGLLLVGMQRLRNFYDIFGI
jgi:hypothetical protein